MRDDDIEERDASPPDNDRLLVRPYVRRPGDEAEPADDAYRLPESGDSIGDDGSLASVWDGAPAETSLAAVWDDTPAGGDDSPSSVGADAGLRHGVPPGDDASSGDDGSLRGDDYGDDTAYRDSSSSEHGAPYGEEASYGDDAFHGDASYPDDDRFAHDDSLAHDPDDAVPGAAFAGAGTTAADLPTAALPRVPAPAEHPDPALDDRDRRQVLWLVGVGIAIAVAAVAGLIALWPRGEEAPPTVAVPPDSVAWPRDSGPSSAVSGGAPARSTAPSSAATTSKPTSKPAAQSTTAAPGGATTTTAPQDPGAPRPAPPKTTAPTLAPPPASDRVGPITAAGRCLDVANGIVFPGSSVAVYECNGTLSQRWTVASDGTLRAAGSCATADGSGAVEIAGCGDATTGQWRGGPGGTLVNVESGRCLTDPTDGDENGARVRLAACGGSGQRWALP
jgi:hypothetical protein